jgi:lipoprotein-anchoring transpeptidase ErfK/SrfK
VLTALLLTGLVWVWRQTGQRAAPRPPVKTPQPAHSAVSKSNSPPLRAPSAPPVAQPVPVNSPARPVVTRPPTVPPATNDLARAPQNTFEAQLALTWQGISAGSIDGVPGSQTRAALRAFQTREHLPVTGELDPATRSRVRLDRAPVVSYQVTSNDLARLQPVAPTWLGKSQQSALDYETLLELVAEKFHAHPAFVRALNPTVNWSNVVAGTELRVPNAAYPEPAAKAACLRISLAGKTLEAFDAATNLLAHFPCSIAQRVEKRPVGELHVIAIAPDPNYTFDPEVFPESPEARAIGHKLILPPGPNNPVGVAWISLDRPGYGIHGTPSPEQVGRTESHGCFRLANWNAAYLLKLVNIGTPVYVVP